MSDVYVFQASFLCYDCGAAVCDELDSISAVTDGDSDEYPQGPYADGGGEGDSPAHCDSCGTFLENPLTTEGYYYVIEAVKEHYATGKGNKNVIAEWKDFYDIKLDSDDGEE